MSKLKSSANYLYRRRRQLYDQIIRVNHSGELAADRIYWGQFVVLANDDKHSPVIQEMWSQEKHHLQEFEKLSLKYRCRKSALQHIWSATAFTLGAVTAAIGPKAAMACTVAVEDVICQHYDNQLRQLINDNIDTNKHLIDTIKEFRDDEQHHFDTGIEFGAKDSIAFNVLYNVISNGCRVAIKIAEKI
ncbi:5-demethoxyubiquinone hydroxylase, mitochondrial-like [Oppia nitens]|uniref:5-demethoxyubiquinone hydroxylase, mitochondrial-like n=1 Tax=Oppia nitens TaxID=1686743 RepID=UPI0023DB072B|nr:5-demethoxyubiquinone hydroxylase, mitochondrial-like [Oppia nitens]